MRKFNYTEKCVISVGKGIFYILGAFLQQVVWGYVHLCANVTQNDEGAQFPSDG